jgi:methionyl-tRNA synthetase
MKPTIEYPDFEKLDIRIGKVIAAEVPTWSNKLIQFRVDFGEEIGQKTILSGIQKWYTPEDFLNKNFPFIVNLAERKMGEGISQGMMIMADTNLDPEGHPVVLPLSESILPGTIIR